MLFLPQFTCEFSEENEKNHDDEDSVSSGSTAGPTQNKEEEEELTPEEIAAQAKEDEALKSEIGLGKVKVIENGVLLKPNPVGIVWAPGLGVKTSQVRQVLSSIFFISWELLKSLLSPFKASRRTQEKI